MQLTMLKAKLHKATVTHAELEYEGSCAIDEHLLAATGMLEHERIEIYNIANGERFTTYIIRAAAGSGIISINGAAAHKAQPGHRIIICAYAQMTQAEAQRFKPSLVYLDHTNQIVRTSTETPVQAA